MFLHNMAARNLRVLPITRTNKTEKKTLEKKFQNRNKKKLDLVEFYNFFCELFSANNKIFSIIIILLWGIMNNIYGFYLY